MSPALRARWVALSATAVFAVLCAAAFAVIASEQPVRAAHADTGALAPGAPHSGLAGAAAHADAGAPAPGAPHSGLAGATPLAPDQQFRITGRVEERLAAGTYTYLRVRPDGASDATWIVLSVDPAQLAARERVDVRVMSRAENFRSHRLDREFAVLLFAALLPDAPPERGATRPRATR